MTTSRSSVSRVRCRLIAVEDISGTSNSAAIWPKTTVAALTGINRNRPKCTKFGLSRRGSVRGLDGQDADSALATKVEFLSRLSAYGPATGAVVRRETHMSWVFLV